jgi:elongator complex protein 3
MLAEFTREIPEYVRVMRVQRDIPTPQTTSGVDRTNLRQYLDEELKKKGIACRCIRCREIGRKPAHGEVKYRTIAYEASLGQEFFIAAEIEDSLVGFCRVRFPFSPDRKEITTDSALLRELHVYGQATGLGKEGEVQHKGVGRKLMEIAENLAQEHGKKKMVVISGIGVREYYYNLGYVKEGPYVVKGLH